MAWSWLAAWSRRAWLTAVQKASQKSSARRHARIRAASWFWRGAHDGHRAADRCWSTTDWCWHTADWFWCAACWFAAGSFCSTKQASVNGIRCCGDNDTSKCQQCKNTLHRFGSKVCWVIFYGESKGEFPIDDVNIPAARSFPNWFQAESGFDRRSVLNVADLALVMPKGNVSKSQRACGKPNGRHERRLQYSHAVERFRERPLLTCFSPSDQGCRSLDLLL